MGQLTILFYCCNTWNAETFILIRLSQSKITESLNLKWYNAYSNSPYIDKELTAKTKELLYQNISISDLEMPGVIYELGAEQLAKLKASDISDTVKVLNLSKALGNVVREKSAQSPFLLSIGERADKVIQAYENRQINTQEALAQLVPNHGKVFKSLMYAYLPNWEEREQRLQSYASLTK